MDSQQLLATLIQLSDEQINQGDIGPEVTHFLGNRFQSLFLAQSRALQLVQAFLGVAVARAMPTCFL